MKKIYTKSVLEYNKRTKKYELNEEESDWYYIDGNLAIGRCGGGDSGGGGQQTVQSVQSSEPWGPQQPFVKTGFKEVKDKFLNTNTYPQPYPNPIAVPFSPETEAAMQMQTNRSLFGSPIQAAGTQQLTNTLNGSYLNQMGDVYNNPMQQMVNNEYLAPTIRGDNLYGGPGFNAAFQAASNKIIPQIDSAFGNAGRRSSGLADVAKTQALGDAFAGLYGQNLQIQNQAAQQAQQGTNSFLDSFNKERQLGMQAALTAPQFSQLDYQDAAKLAEVGAQREALQQQNLNQNISSWDLSQNLPRSSVAQYMNLIQGNYGGTTSGSSTTTASPAGGGFSPNIMGGLGGMLMSKELGVNPIIGMLGGIGF
jgi:hypothetical protein